MNEEEKKAIERLEEQLNFWKKQNIKNSDCEIILNLITKLQKENKEKDKQIDLILIGQIQDGYLVNFNNLEEAREYYNKLAKEKEE